MGKLKLETKRLKGQLKAAAAQIRERKPAEENENKELVNSLDQLKLATKTFGTSFAQILKDGKRGVKDYNLARKAPEDQNGSLSSSLVNVSSLPKAPTCHEIPYRSSNQRTYLTAFDYELRLRKALESQSNEIIKQARQSKIKLNPAN